MEAENTEELLLNMEIFPNITEEEYIAFKTILIDFMKCYAEKKDEPVEAWLTPKLEESLPEKNPAEIQSMVTDIVHTLDVLEEKNRSLGDAVKNGRSKESWFATEVQKSMSAMSMEEAVVYLNGLDEALYSANESFHRTITAQNGAVSQNPNLDGFIAEQYHAQSFNMNAAAKGSQYRAKVLEPDGERYAKNSVDIVILDKDGNIVNKYQSKYCKDSVATEKAFEHGDYRGQQKLVPEGQQSEIHKKCTTRIEAPDGTASDPLTKESARKMRDEAQSGNWNDLNWNAYKEKDILIGIGKRAGYAGLQGMVVSAGFEIAGKLWNGEEIKGEEVVENALVNGADFGVKAAAAGALKAAVEKDLIAVIPKGTPANALANVAFVGIENMKVAGKVVTGELSVKEGVDKIEQTTVSATAGLLAMGKGAAIGTEIGAVFGPVGMGIGSFLGGTVGYLAGSKVGETIVKGAQKIRDGAVKVVKAVGTGIMNMGSMVVNVIGSIFDCVFG